MKTTIIQKTLLLASILVMGHVQLTQAAGHKNIESINPALLYWKEIYLFQNIQGSKDLSTLRMSKVVTDDMKNFVVASNDIFSRLAQVRKTQVPCDWGDDLSEGPYLLLPHLTECRSLVYAIHIRNKVHAAEGDQESLLSDTLTMFTLNSHIAASPLLINVLVSIACDTIGANSLSENMHYFSQKNLIRIKKGLNNLPERNNIADCIPSEKNFMAGWLIKTMKEVTEDPTLNDEEKDTAFKNLLNEIMGLSGEPFIKEKNNPNESIIKIFSKFIEDAEADYDELEKICRLNYLDGIKKLEAFEKETESSSNILRKLLFPAISNTKSKEFEHMITMSIVKAAIEYQLGNKNAAEIIVDPVSGKPFNHMPVMEGNKQVGFTLESQYQNPKANKRFFRMSPSPKSYHLTGKNAGTEVTPEK